MTRTPWLVAAATLLLGCGEPPSVKPCLDGGCITQETHQYYQGTELSPVDILVVMDDSPSMKDKQARVLAALEGALERVFSARPWIFDFEMRVISSTVPAGDSGVPGCGVGRRASCPLPVGGVFRWNQICGALPNFEGTPEAAVTCAARFSGDGCALEQPLAALEWHLEHGPRFRSNADIFVLIVTDEDDCSLAATPPFAVDPAQAAADDAELSRRCREADEAGMLTPVARYANLLRAVNPSRFVMVALAAGPVSVRGGLCTSFGGAQPAPRLRRFVDQFENFGTSVGFCEEDIGSAVAILGERLGFGIGSPCIDAPLADRDPSQPGVQPACAVSEHPQEGQPRILPPCHLAGPPCWQLRPTPICQASGHTLEIQREGCVPPGGTLIQISCGTEPR